MSRNFSSVPSPEDVQKQVVAAACVMLQARGITFHYDVTSRCWDVELPSGWETASTAGALWSLAVAASQRV